MDNWIDVRDRLPEIHEYRPGSGSGCSDTVFVYLDEPCGNDERIEVWTLRRGGRGDTTTLYWDFDYPRVTHWQPLMPPPTK